MYVNDKMVLQLISLLKQNAIKKIVVSPGSRHNKLIASLENDDFFQLYSVVDERSAGFFALGLIQSCGEPVAITCSSGTACMNYGSAIVEAYYQKLPLLVLSSDRIPQLLNQNEDQMYDQLSTFVKCTKYHCQLPVVENKMDEWYCNRLINEALIALTHRGRGPVHINIPFAMHHGTNFSIAELPKARKINLNRLPLSQDFWKTFAERLINKKIMIIWGQSVVPLRDVEKAVDSFCSKVNAMVITDNISNCHCKYAILNASTVLYSIKPTEKKQFVPDIVLTIGGNYIFNPEIKNWLADTCIEHWHIALDGDVVDPFRKLNEIFEMPEVYFFEQLTDALKGSGKGDYLSLWKNMSDYPPVPSCDYCELYAISSLLNRLPEDCDLQLANSQTIRMAQLVHLNPSIRVNCNRGVNGIDGSMSTAIGFGADSKRHLFYITGELSFFYDMNSLSIKHLSSKMRILLINNQGGAVMYDQARDTPQDKMHIYLAAGNNLSARGWAESLGFDYHSAIDKTTVDKGIDALLDIANEKPVILEVFTDLAGDRFCLGDYLKSIDRRSFPEKVMCHVKSYIK